MADDREKTAGGRPANLDPDVAAALDIIKGAWAEQTGQTMTDADAVQWALKAMAFCITNEAIVLTPEGLRETIRAHVEYATGGEVREVELEGGCFGFMPAPAGAKH